ncbi:MAG: hypothetical protein PHU23_03400 [Dehalococcoidales bacterium]|nr:hypothetical protein [Dehalococcoidales bacterium]
MKKLGLILIALVIALGAMGVGYAAWAQDLTIENTVNMGYISAGFYDASIDTDPYAELSYEIDGSGKTDAAQAELEDVLKVTVTDAYPGFNQTIWFRVVNNGTVPFYLTPGDAVVKYGNKKVSNIAAVVPDISSQVIVEPQAVSAWYSYFLYIPGEDEGSGDFVDPVQKATYTVTIPLTATQFHFE